MVTSICAGPAARWRAADTPRAPTIRPPFAQQALLTAAGHSPAHRRCPLGTCKGTGGRRGVVGRVPSGLSACCRARDLAGNQRGPGQGACEGGMRRIGDSQQHAARWQGRRDDMRASAACSCQEEAWQWHRGIHTARAGEREWEQAREGGEGGGATKCRGVGSRLGTLHCKEATQQGQHVEHCHACHVPGGAHQISA